ncbi:MAG TPA: hypothetical protein VGK99_11405 [Acidobacteriota bacterium]|jgi:hypothetical protein
MAPDWVAPGDIAADPLSDLCTNGHQLSFYEIDDSMSNLDLVVAAHAATRDTFSNFDYVLLERQIVEKDFVIQPSPGTTPSDTANSFHLNFSRMTGKGVAKLAWLMKEHGRIERIQEPSVRSLVLVAVKAGNVILDRMKPGFAEKVRTLLGDAS